MTEKYFYTYNHKPPPDTAQGGFGFIPNGIREKNIFFYHPDHLGSSSYITGQDGKVSQHTEYIAFGEILFDEHNTEHTMPYLFNGKELDQETGLYYYGARYYDPKVSIFVNVDPLVEKTMQPYAYANNNPVRFIDPTGKEPEDDHFNQFGKFLYTDNKSTNNIVIHTVFGTTQQENIQLAKRQAPWQSTELKDMNFDSSNFNTLANIAKHYAKDAGIDVNNLFNNDFSIGAFNNVHYQGGQAYGKKESYNDGKYWGRTSEGATAIMHADLAINKITINVYNGKVNPILNDKYNFISVLSHEGGSAGHLGQPNAKHSMIYENQKQHPLYKHTTSEFKEHIEKNLRYYKSNKN